MIHVIQVAIVFVVMLSILVAAHEYGHYIFARLFGMGVEEFAIGMGRPKIWTWMRRTYEVDAVQTVAETGSTPEPATMEYPTDGSAALQPEAVPSPTPRASNGKITETTDFTIRAWPIGGFVRIKGMMPEEDGSETKIPGGFYSKAPWKRLIVLFAGPVFSVLSGVLILFFLSVSMGRQVPNGTLLADVLEGGPASRAGLQKGDRIIAIDGKATKSFYEVTQTIKNKAGVLLSVQFERDGKVLERSILPRLDTEASPVLGPDYRQVGEKRKQVKILAQWAYKSEPVGVGEAFVTAAMVPYEIVAELADRVTKPSKLKEAVGGPISIAKATSDATQRGLDWVVTLAAMLSISLGIFNLLPITPLDGGQMVVAFAEMLRGGKRLSMRVQGAVAAVGFTLIMMMVVSIMFIDIGRITGKPPESKVISKDK